MNERRKQTLFRVVLVVLGCLAGFGIIEGIGGIAIWAARHSEKPELPAELVGRVLESKRHVENAHDPYLAYRPKPNQQTRTAHINSLGLRGAETDALPGPGVYRILLLGGSVAWGYTSMSDDETPSEVLESYLNAHRRRSRLLRDKTIEVLNGAVPGYVAWQEALVYAMDYRRLKPNLIVTLDGTNDYAAAINTGLIGVPMGFDEASRGPAEKPSLLGSLWSWLKYRIGRMRFSKYLEHVRRPSLADRAPPPGEQVAAGYRRALEHIADIAAIEHALVVPVLQPMAILSGTKPLSEFERQLIAYHDLRVPGVNAAYDETFEDFRSMFVSLASERPGVFPLDATRVFADVSEITYVDHCHLTPRGRELLAAAIGDWILEVTDAAR
jgi:hypothetical protein